MNKATLTDSIFGAVADPSRPLLTYYDDRTGERTELSGATLGNWAAKTANFLADEMGVGPGDTVRVDLPEHWQTAGILLGAWWSGAHVRLGTRDGPDDRVVFASVGGIDDHPDADELVVASLDAFALPLRDLPPGVADFGSAVRIHGDGFTSRPYAGPVLEGTDAPTIAQQAAAVASAAGIGAAARVLSTREWRTRDGVIANLLAPWLAGAGLVHIAGADASSLPGRAETEKATIILS